MLRPLRPYQQDAISYVLSSRSQAGYVSQPTGTGKTREIAGLCEKLPGRILVIAHRKELIDQMASAIYQDAKEMPGIMMGKQKQSRERITVGTIQTLTLDNLEMLLVNGPIDTLLIDECHHVVSNSGYEKIVNKLREVNPVLRVIGFTATPYRADEARMQEILPDCFFERSIPDMQREKWLCPVTWSSIEIPLSLEGIKMSTAGGERDFDAKELVIRIAPHTHYLVQQVKDFLTWEAMLGRDRPTVVFCCNVEHAKEVAECFARYGVSAAAVWGGMPQADRDYVLDAWKRLQIKVVCNVGVLTEGFDYTPRGQNKNGLGCVVIFRPTKSPALYLQMLGRGTRLKPADSEFQDCYVFDVGNANLLDTKQITLPKVIPAYQEPDSNKKEIKVGYDEDLKETKKRSFTLRVNDPLALSWASWGFHSGSGTYYTSLSVQGVYAFMYRRKSGLYNGGILTRDQNNNWLCQWITDEPKTLIEMMHHANHVFSQHGYKRHVEKNAKWRQHSASEKQLALVKRVAPDEYLPSLTKEEAGNILSWFSIRQPLINALKDLRAHVERERVHV